MADPNARRFTMVHLLVVVGIMIFLIGLLMPTMRDRGEPANRIKCASNLRQIGLAMKMYADGETRTHAYPRTIYSKADAARPTAFTKPDAANPFAEDGPTPNDVTAALFLVLRTQEITTDVFVCPNSETATRMTIPSGKDIKSFSNFPSPDNLSYSMQNPYPTEAAERAGFTWDDTIPADFAIMADKNPGVAGLTTVTITAQAKDQRTINSANHDQDGQNVLYADGHVDWSASVWGGLNSDNIYGYNAPSKIATTGPATRPAPLTSPPTPIGIIGPPADGNDSVLLPVK